jgi:septal ring factor EnvC (AmiA/AmiB activator)
VLHHLQQLASLEGSLAEEKLRQREEMQSKLEAQRRRSKETLTQQQQLQQQCAPLPSPRADLLAR